MNNNIYNLQPNTQEVIDYALDHSLDTDYLYTNQYNNQTLDQIVTIFKEHIYHIDTFCEVKIVEVRNQDTTISFCFHNDICCQAFIFCDNIDTSLNNMLCHCIDTCPC